MSGLILSIRPRLNGWLTTHRRIAYAICTVLLIIPVGWSGSVVASAAITGSFLVALLVYYVCLFESVDTSKRRLVAPDGCRVFEACSGGRYSIRFESPPPHCEMKPGEVRVGNALAGSTIVAPMFGRVFILKADDLGNPVSLSFRRCIDVIYRNKAKIALGLIVRDYSPQWRDRVIRAVGRMRRAFLAVLSLGRRGDLRGLKWRSDYLRALNSYTVEFYCHGWDHHADPARGIFEFQNSGCAYQDEHLRLARSVLERLGLATRVFGAPFLRTDSDTPKALLNNGFKVFLAPGDQRGCQEEGGLLRMPIRLWLEDWRTDEATERGRPRTVAEIVGEYEEYADLQCVVGHMHPDRWASDLESFDSLIGSIQKTRQFWNPEEYYRLLVDMPHFKLERLSLTDYILDLSRCQFNHFVRVRRDEGQKIEVDLLSRNVDR